MDFTYFPGNVIYNIHSPNQTKCINPEAKSIANAINDGIDINRFKATFISHLNMNHDIVSLVSDKHKNRQIPRPFPVNPHKFNNTPNQNRFPTTRIQTRNTVIPQVRPPAVPAAVPPINTLELENLLRTRFNCTHAKDFLKFARTAGGKIRADFRETRKAPTLQWIASYWNDISPILDEIQI